ncbi:nucleotide-diphospho-sugar transferase-domain-containing protein [Syncephalastrum racemosum]|uniref:Nucleotide-diphospho-sugar transferase-domain-containing protein n=1 Tax=Syncephalastrum racemosum TaxID=13706 RepID=A0A1X2HQJ4_SYNRA|nr:nucleotide-diphospho-sugar transferase-domain-containing protein [Syncephalastrum racemosum]
MSYFDRSSSRKSLLVAAAMVTIFLVLCLHLIAGTTEDDQDQQQGLTIGSPGKDPWYCSCYLSDAEQQEKDDDDDSNNNNKIDGVDYGEAGPLVVPASFTEPDQTLVNKINANLNENRVLIVAASNYGMRDHVYNWIESLKRTGEGDKFLMFCLDDQMYEHMVEAGYEKNAATIPENWFHQEVDAGFEEYYSKKYRIITHAKTLIVQQLLYLDVTVLFSDVDIVWLRPRLREFIYTFLDIREETHVAFQQEGSDQKVINSGFYMMRPSDVTKRLLAETIYLGDTNEAMTQQGAMNEALNHVDMDLRSTAVTLLDVLHFPNGYIYFENDWCDKHGVDPFIVHANYLVGDDKRKRLEERGFWYLDDAWLAGIDARMQKKQQEKEQAKGN